MRNARGLLRFWLYLTAVTLFMAASCCLVPASAQTTDWSTLIQAAKPAVVYIETDKGRGSGTIISPDGYILTAAHVISGANRITVWVEESRQYIAMVAAADYAMDVAALKIPASGLTWLALGDSDKVMYDQDVRALGYPWQGAGRGFVASAATIDGFRTRDTTDLIQFTAVINPGNSGGTLIGESGEIIGVVSELWSQAQFPEAPPTPFALAVCINTARQIIPYGALPSGSSPVQPIGSTQSTAPIIHVPQDQPTIASAVRVAAQGAEIQVATGTYAGDVSITKSVAISGTGNPVLQGTLRMSAAENVTVTGIEVTGGVEIRDSSSFTLDRVVISGSGGDGVVIESSSGTISGCTIEESTGNGLVASFGARVSVLATRVRDSAGAGIVLSLDAQARIAGCTLEGNGGDGIRVASCTADIRDNSVQANGAWGIASDGGASITPGDLRLENRFAGNQLGAVWGLGPAFFVVTGISVSPCSTCPVRTEATITATITNVGSLRGIKEMWLIVDGTRVAGVSVSLDPGQNDVAILRHAFDSEKTWQVTVSGPDTASATLELRSLETSYGVELGSVSISPNPGAPGGQVGVSVTLTNRTGLPTAGTVHLELDSAGGDSAYVVLDRDEVKTVLFRLTMPPTDGGFTVAITFQGSASAGRAIAASSECIRTLAGVSIHGSVDTVAFSPDGQLLVSAGTYEDILYLWNMTSGALVRTLTGHTRSIWSVAFSPDGVTLASGSNDTTVKLWDATTGEELRTLSGHTGHVHSVAFSPDGKTLASGSIDKTIKLWDVTTGSELRTLAGRTSWVNSVAFSPDGKFLVSGSWDGVIRLWDVATGEELRTLAGHTYYVIEVAFSPDGQTLASVAGDHTVKLWNVITGRALRTLQGDTGAAISLSFSPDGESLALGGGRGDGTVRIWDVDSGQLVRELGGCAGALVSVAFSPDGRTLVSGSGLSGSGQILLWSVVDGTVASLAAGHSAGVMSVAFSADGNSLISGSEDGLIMLWRPDTGALMRTLAGHTGSVLSTACSPDGEILVSGSGDKTAKLWDVATGEEIRTLVGHTAAIFSVAFSPDRKILASGSADKTIKLWDAGTGEELHTLFGHSDFVSSVVFSPDGKTLASGSIDETIKLWDVTTGEELRTLVGHTDTIFSVAFSPDGKFLVSGSADKTIKLWDVGTGEELRTLAGHTDSVRVVAFSPDGRTLASGSQDQAIELWDVATGRLLRALFSHTSGVVSVAFSPDGTLLASGSSDKTIKLWDVSDLVSR